jgi:hypothetical protein
MAPTAEQSGSEQKVFLETESENEKADRIPSNDFAGRCCGMHPTTWAGEQWNA